MYYPLSLFSDLNLRVMKDEVHSPHLGYNRSKTHEVAERLCPCTELREKLIKNLHNNRK